MPGRIDRQVPDSGVEGRDLPFAGGQRAGFLGLARTGRQGAGRRRWELPAARGARHTQGQGGRSDGRAVRERGGRARLVSLPEGRTFPTFLREEAGLSIAHFDRKGALEPLLVPPGRYTLCYGSYGTRRTRGRAVIRDGAGTVRCARPGTHRISLLAKPGEYSAQEMLEVGEDESIVVRITTPPLPERSGARRNDPKTPNEGPLTVKIEREGFPSERQAPGIYWL